MRVLVIDDSPEFRSRVAQYLAAAMPDAELTLWDPATQGRPAVGFDWRKYDALLLDDTPGAGADGLEWLAEFHAEGHVPPTLVLSDTGGEVVSPATMVSTLNRSSASSAPLDCASPTNADVIS